MLRVSDVARAILSSVASDGGELLVNQWVMKRYGELASRIRFRHLRVLGEVIVPAVITTGTMTVTRGSKTVTGNAAAIATWSSDLVGRYFQTSTNWYRIAGFLPDSTLQLTSEFAEDDVSAGTYRIVARVIPLGDRIRYVTAMALVRRRWIIEIISADRLAMNEPQRQYATSGPTVAAEQGVDEAGRKLFEFYPYSEDTELVQFVGYNSPDLDEQLGDAILPDVLEVHHLESGTMIDVFRQKMVTAASAGKIEEAALWRNEYRAQETSWRRVIEEVAQVEKGTDDVGFLVRRLGIQTFGDIKTARQEIFARGARP